MRTLVAAVLLSVSWLVHAHSPITSTSPEKDALVDTPPKTVTLNFKNKFRLTRVTSTHGSRDSVNLDTSHLTDFAKTFELPFVSMGAGQYRIEWRGLGSDSHVQSGAFKFTVK